MSAKAFSFDAKQVAYYEVEGWKAYYDRNWLRLLRLVLSLNQAQFRIPFPQSLQASYYVTRASVAFVPKEHDRNIVIAYLEKFYRMALRHSGLNFAPGEAARWENEYWEVHRRLSGLPDKTDFIAAMTQLHATVFGLTPEQAAESANLRVEANNVLDTITAHTSPDPAHDWLRCEDLLTRCYASIARLKA
jgi:hypothetical protein